MGDNDARSASEVSSQRLSGVEHRGGGSSNRAAAVLPFQNPDFAPSRRSKCYAYVPTEETEYDRA